MLVFLLSQIMADEISIPPLVSYAFDDQSQHMVVASCLTGVGYLSIFYVKSEFQTIKLSKQTSFEEACTEGILLSLQLCPTSVNIYVHNPISRVNSVYRANETHLWESVPASDEINKIIFGIARHQMVGPALLEIDVPKNYPGFKV
jgi:hypothetical protein